MAARLVAIAGTVVALVLLVSAFQRLTLGAEPADGAPSAYVVLRASPIAAEHDVLRGSPEAVPAPPWLPRRGTAHPRTLATARALRAYAGAPPRIPHGLTREEFRSARCLTCHARGGYSPRFGAYVPVTPHPEFEGCLQCHVPDDAVVRVSLPDRARDATCHQCHPPGAPQRALPASDWVAAPWPTLAAPQFVPPTIPHPLQLRGNCLACHMGPGAVAEIRTTHPERANCRQCHVAAGDATDAWVRSATDSPASGEVRR
jgi:nitrate reductase cytochrome c-type subunit